MHRKATIAKCLLTLSSALVLAAPVLASPASEECDIANRLAREGIWDSAVMFYEKALALNPYYMPALAGRAAALRHMHLGGDGEPAKHRRKKDKKPKVASAQTKNAHETASPAAKEKHDTADAAIDISPATEPKPDLTEKAQAATMEAPPATAATASAPAKSAMVTPTAVPLVPTTPAASVNKAESEHASPATKPQASSMTEHASSAQPDVVKDALHQTIKTDTGVKKPDAKASQDQDSEQTIDGIKLPSSADDDKSGSDEKPASDKSAAQSQSDQTHSTSPPSWLILVACAVFAVIVVVAVWWLSPTMYKARQSQHKLKQVEKSGSDEF
ncbi:MAG TPA: hypothetical protein V6C81_15510 [Planktothrix sp.]|jgi:hypothetical protein